jgi:hypothetical protein
MSKSTSYALPAIIVIAIAGVVLWPWIMPHSDGHYGNQCLSKVKQMGVGMAIYQSDYDERFPARDWMTAEHTYVKNWDVFRCIEVDSTLDQFGFGMNLALFGVDARTLADPAKVPLIFEVDALGKDVAVNLAAATSGRHETRKGLAYYAVYADTHAIWKPKGTPP